jgi:hypothetical protein
MKESPISLHIATPGAKKFFLGHHGTTHDLSIAIGYSHEVIESFIDILPKKAKELEEISRQSPDSDRMFFNMVRQSFRYLQSMIDLKDVEEEKGLDSKEYKDIYELRDKCLELVIKSINAWSASLSKNSISNTFMKSIITNSAINTLYGMFVVGFVSDIYTDKNFEIEKYSK